MTAIFLSRRWRRQPTHPAPIADAFRRPGLSVFLPPHLVDLATGKTSLTKTAYGKFGVGRSGLEYEYTGSDFNNSFTAADGGTGESWLFVVDSIPSAADYIVGSSSNGLRNNVGTLNLNVASSTRCQGAAAIAAGDVVYAQGTNANYRLVTRYESLADTGSFGNWANLSGLGERAGAKYALGIRWVGAPPPLPLVLSLIDNPWQVIRRTPRRIYFGGASAAALAGDATGSASATGALTTAIPIAGAALGIATASGALSTAIPLAGAAAAVVDAGGALTAQITLSGEALAQAIAVAALSTGITLTADAVAEAAASGSLDTIIALIASASAQASATGDLSAGAGGAELAGAATAAATVTGALSVEIRLSAAALAQALASGDLSSSIALAAEVLAQAGAAGVLTSSIRLDAAALAQALVSGSLTTSIALSGAAAGLASASGELSGGSLVVLAPDPRYSVRAEPRLYRATAIAATRSARAVRRDYSVALQ